MRLCTPCFSVVEYCVCVTVHPNSVFSNFIMVTPNRRVQYLQNENHTLKIRTFSLTEKLLNIYLHIIAQLSGHWPTAPLLFAQVLISKPQLYLAHSWTSHSGNHKWYSMLHLSSYVQPILTFSIFLYMSVAYSFQLLGSVLNTLHTVYPGSLWQYLSYL